MKRQMVSCSLVLFCGAGAMAADVKVHPLRIQPEMRSSFQNALEESSLDHLLRNDQFGRIDRIHLGKSLGETPTRIAVTSSKSTGISQLRRPAGNAASALQSELEHPFSRNLLERPSAPPTLSPVTGEGNLLTPNAADSSSRLRSLLDD